MSITRMFTEFHAQLRGLSVSLETTVWLGSAIAIASAFRKSTPSFIQLTAHIETMTHNNIIELANAFFWGKT